MQSIHIRVPDEVHARLRKESFENHQSMNAVILEALQRDDRIYESWKAASKAADLFETNLRNAERALKAATDYEAAEWGISYPEFPSIVNRFGDRESAEAHARSAGTILKHRIWVEVDLEEKD